MDCKNIKQTKANKAKYNSPLIELLGTGRKTKEQLMDILHCSDRTVRALVSELAMYYPVISSSDKKGYLLPKEPSKCERAELVDFCDLLEHALNDYEARIKVLKKRLKPIIAYLSVAKEVLTDGKE